MEKFDVVVIGGGPGGYPAAIRAAQLGASVALVEKESLGGTCLNWGCIPTKSLIAGADLLARVNHSEALGLKPGRNGFDYAAMVQHKNGVVAKLKGGVEQLLKANGVKVFRGVGSFAERGRVAVGNAEQIEAGRVIIATGSESAVPGFIPRAGGVMESRKFLDQTTLPGSLVVLGGGVIGCEFACMAAQLGVKVTIVELLEDILIVVDPDVRRALRQHMENDLKIRILTGKPLEKISAGKDGVSGMFGEEKVEGDVLLVSVGRRPVTQGLDLAKAGLEANERGFIAIDEFCRTRVATVFAIGDVTAGSTQLAHAATAQGIVAAENAVGKMHRRNETIVPACIFTSPEIGSVGMTEQAAKAAGADVKVGKFPFAGLGKAMAAGETHGFVKWVTSAKTGQLLGAQAVGAHATELISEAAVAIRAELTVDELGHTIHCHPTFSEAWMEAAHAVHGQCIHAAPRRAGK
jgi:dihydrolipoamide dehydrogenase